MPILAMLMKSLPRSSTIDKSIWLQNDTVFCCGTGRTEELNEIAANVSLMSFLRSSNGVSMLFTIKTYER